MTRMNWDRANSRQHAARSGYYDPVTAPHRQLERLEAAEAAKINQAFDTLAKVQLPVTFSLFIASLKVQWRHKRWLSPKQRTALFNAADRQKKNPTRKPFGLL